MKIVIAPDSFKESLSAFDVATAIQRGLQAVLKDIRYDLAPMADGGEGIVDAMVHATQGTFVNVGANDPLMTVVQSRYGILGDGKTAVIEMAAASGLPLVLAERRNPMYTTTYGTGELIRSALDRNVEKIVIGIGGSATVDGGAGAVQALGAKLLDEDSKPIEPGGQGLARLARIDMAHFDERIAQTEILVACDVDNHLTGHDGAAVVYGPQKGATPEMVPVLDRNLKHYANVVNRDLGVDVENASGAGAAGGLGAALMAFCQARLQNGSKLVADAINLEDRLRDADLCITGEGQIDGSSRFGKVCFHVAELAARHDVPAVAVVGSVGEGAEKMVPPLSAFFSIINRPMELNDALRNADAMIAQLVEQLARTLDLKRT